MSRSTMLVPGPVAAFALMVALSACAITGYRPAAVDTIAIEVQCAEDPIRFHVSPWSARVSRGTELRWTHQGPGLVSTRIIPKDPDTWPFDDRPPEQAVRAAQEITTGARLGRREVPEDPRTGRRERVHHYSILLDCGERGTFDIDPDVVIDDVW